MRDARTESMASSNQRPSDTHNTLKEPRHNLTTHSYYSSSQHTALKKTSSGLIKRQFEQNLNHLASSNPKHDWTSTKKVLKMFHT